MSTAILSMAICAIGFSSGGRLSNLPSSIKSKASFIFGNISESLFSGLTEPSPPKALLFMAFTSFALTVLIFASFSEASVLSLLAISLFIVFTLNL